MEIITPINAIISWEGYEIQGHIALKKIEEYCESFTNFTRNFFYGAPKSNPYPEREEQVLWDAIKAALAQIEDKQYEFSLTVLGTPHWKINGEHI